MAAAGTDATADHLAEADRPLAAPAGDLGAGAPLPVSAVARRLGVAPATLRTWDRRYGLGPTAHAAGAHRRYAPCDVTRLETMRRLVLAGVAPGDAARQVLDQDEAPGPAEAERPRRGGPGGRVLPVPGAGPVVRGLGRAAMALDSPAVYAIIRDQLAEHGVVPTWEHVLRPVLAAAGARWQATGQGVEVEHLLSECTTDALRALAAAHQPAAGPSVPRPVVLAGGPAEQHALPLHVLAAALAERGTASRVLGPAVPEPALSAAVRRTGASAVFVWAQFPSTASPAALAALPVTRPPTAVVVGGPGWAEQELPDRAAFATDLSSALDLLVAAAA